MAEDIFAVYSEKSVQNRAKNAGQWSKVALRKYVGRVERRCVFLDLALGQRDGTLYIAVVLDAPDEEEE